MKTFPGRERNPLGSFDIKKSRGGYLCRCFKIQLFWKSRLFSLFLKFDVVIRVTYPLCEKYLRFFMHGLYSDNLLMVCEKYLWFFIMKWLILFYYDWWCLRFFKGNALHSFLRWTIFWYFFWDVYARLLVIKWSFARILFVETLLGFQSIEALLGLCLLESSWIISLLKSCWVFNHVKPCWAQNLVGSSFVGILLKYLIKWSLVGLRTLLGLHLLESC